MKSGTSKWCKKVCFSYDQSTKIDMEEKLWLEANEELYFMQDKLHGSETRYEDIILH